jgi:Lrp/AsnC family leucine-responsive transcriptional regulator
MISSLDYKALKRLMVQGRATWAELAGDMGLSAPAAAERVRKLEQQMVITGYAALVDPAAVGYPLTAFVSVTLDRPKHRAAFLTAIGKMTEVVECFHIAGDGDYLLKVRCRGTHDLDQLLTSGIKGVPGIARTRTTIVLSTLKDSVVTPVAVNNDD